MECEAHVKHLDFKPGVKMCYQERESILRQKHYFILNHKSLVQQQEKHLGL